MFRTNGFVPAFGNTLHDCLKKRRALDVDARTQAFAQHRPEVANRLEMIKTAAQADVCGWLINNGKARVNSLT